MHMLAKSILCLLVFCSRLAQSHPGPSSPQDLSGKARTSWFTKRKPSFDTDNDGDDDGDETTHSILTPNNHKADTTEQVTPAVESKQQKEKQQKETKEQEEEELQKMEIDDEISSALQRDNMFVQPPRRKAQQQHRSPWTASAAVVGPLLSDPRRLGRWAATGLQVGLIVYLAQAVWKATAEILDEYSQEIQGNDPSMGKNQVAQVVQFIEERMLDPPVLSDKRPSALPSVQLLEVAQKLLASGLPLRSPPEPSVQSVLMQLTRSEIALLQQCLWSEPSIKSSSISSEGMSLDSMKATWKKVAGLESVKERLLSTLVALRSRVSNMSLHQQQQQILQHGEAFASLFEDSNTAAGVLLYGPPGCGKTLLVKTLAATSRIPCLVVSPSVLLRKYVGETNLQVRSLFAVAKKLAPCIVCIDELDGLFRERSDNEHEVSRDLKTEFLQWWDGMLGNGGARILLIGATNRPFDVDSAVLRRLPQSHYVGLPDLTARATLLRQWVESIPTDPDNFDVLRIARATEGYSPSDLRHVLQTAALTGPIRDSTIQPTSARPMTTEDVFRAIQSVPATPLSYNYQRSMDDFRRKSTSVAPESNNNNNNANGLGNFYNLGTVHFEGVYDASKNIDNEPLEDDGEDDQYNYDPDASGFSDVD